MAILKSKWLVIVLVVLIGWLGLSFIKIKLHEYIVNKEIGDLQLKMDSLQKSNSELEKFISYMANPGFLEKQARILLNYKAPDEEVVFVYPDSSPKAGSSSPDFNKELGEAPNYIKWWRYLLED